MLAMRMTRLALLVLGVGMTSLVCGCRPKATSDFKAAQQAFQNVSRIKAEWSAKTYKGNFQNTAEVDCASPYYHRSSITDLTERGIAAEARSELGRPLAHQEVEYLFVEGKSFVRSSGVWGSDAQPDWAPPAGGSYDPTSDCQEVHQGKYPSAGPFAQDVRFVPVLDLGRILAGNQIEYVAERTLADGNCREYRVVYEDAVETSSLATSNGTYSSYDMRPVPATVCLGVKDRLPKQVVQGDWTVKFSYGAFDRLVAPSVAEIRDPTPPGPPDSTELSTTSLDNYPAFMALALGGLASEGEKINLVFEDKDLRLFRTDASATQVSSFYASEMRARGWVANGPMASNRRGMSISEYRINHGQEALFIVIEEPEDSNSSNLTDSRRHVLLVHARQKTA